MGTAQASKLSQESDYELEEDEEYYVTRPHSSVRRYNQPPQRDTLDDVDILKGASVHPRRSNVKPYPGSGKLSHPTTPSGIQGWFKDKRFQIMSVFFTIILMPPLFPTSNTFSSYMQ